MVLSASTGPAHPTAWWVPWFFVACALIALGCYAFACWRWPYGACRKCKGRGRFPSPTTRYWRPCPRCGGTSRRVRVGRRVLEKLLTRERSEEA
jgi:hypothetical protein